MAVHEIRIDPGKTLAEEPGTGRNRWHPGIAPAVRCAPGDEVVLETRDAFDGQMSPDASPQTVAAPNLDVVHPLTGPVYVEGAEPGDVLKVEILAVEPDRYGYTVQVPGFGFLRDVFPEAFKVNWEIADGWATSAGLPGVRIPGAPFMGTIGLAPGHELLAATTAREQALLDRGGFVSPPTLASAVPADPRLAAEGLRVLLNMIDHLTERGWTRQQAYAICGVAGDLKISQLVDAPNMLVSAFLPEDIFTG